MGSFNVVFSTGAAAAELWAFGEDTLAEAALRISEEQMPRLWHLAAQFYDSSYPLPIEGVRVSLGHVIAFAFIEHIEGRLRPLARSRRRPASSMPTHITDAREATNASLSAMRTRVLHDQ